jgi:hypothetical protein
MTALKILISKHVIIYYVTSCLLMLSTIDSFKIANAKSNKINLDIQQGQTKNSKIILIKQAFHQSPLPNCNYVYNNIRTNLQNYEITFFNSFFRLFDVKYKTRNLARFQSSVLNDDKYNLYRFKHFDKFEWPVRYYSNLGKNYEGVLLKIGEFVYRESSFLRFLNENTKIQLLKNADSIVRLREKGLRIGRRLRKSGELDRNNQSLFNVWKCEILDPLKKIFGPTITNYVSSLPLSINKKVHIVPTKKKPFRKIDDKYIKKVVINRNRFIRAK